MQVVLNVLLLVYIVGALCTFFASALDDEDVLDTPDIVMCFFQGVLWFIYLPLRWLGKA